MGLRFLGQPFADSEQIGGAIVDALGAPNAERLWIATAWAKRSGISRVASAITTFRAAGGTSEVIVGIDEGGASQEGLELSLELFDEVFIYHDPGTRTFHPKIYAVESNDRAVVLVGSGNLTQGGLFTNYEAALVLDAARESHEEWAVRDDVRAYFDLLLAAGDAIRRLDDDLIELLTEGGWVESEARQNARRARQSTERREREALFGRAVGGLAGAPPPQLAPLPNEDEDEDTPLPSPEQPAPATTPPPAAPPPPITPPALPPAAPQPVPTVVESWSKVLARGDAQQPSNPATNPTGVLRLNRANHRDSTGQLINHLTWFRHVLFLGSNWAPDTDGHGNPIEIAVVPIAVTVRGVSHGTTNLVVDHGPHREAGQGNVPTILHWGSLLPLLRATDCHGDRVTISRMSDGTYRLDIS